MIKGIIFDLDGLLVDSERYWNKARVAMAAEVGKDWTEADLRAVMGVNTREWAEYMVRRLELAMPWQAVQDHIVDRMAAMYRQGIPFMPGAVEAVALSAENFPTALASGSHRRLIDAVLSDSRMQGKFQVVLSADQVGVGKPAPDVYLQTAQKLGLNPADCLCFEDSANGILAGRRAGMKVVAVPDHQLPPPADILAQADVVLDSLADFSLDLLGRWRED